MGNGPNPAEQPVTNRLLSKGQLKELFTLTEATGLDPSGFNLEEVIGVEGCLVHEFRHPETRAFLRFDWNVMYRTGLSLEWWPLWNGRDHHFDAPDWSQALRLFTVWLSMVRDEVSTPDVWTIARNQRAWLTSTAAAFEGNTPFTVQEQSAIAQHLRTIEEFTIKTHELQAEQSEFLHEQMRYLTDAATRVGRFDWKNLAASTFVNVLMTLGLDAEKGHRVLALATQLLGPLVTGVRALMQG